MAKIVCEYDTVEKEMTVSVDGKELADVSHFSCCDDYGCSINVMNHDEENDLRTSTVISASESPEGKIAISEGCVKSKLIDGYVEKKTMPMVINDIARYLNGTSHKNTKKGV